MLERAVLGNECINTSLLFECVLASFYALTIKRIIIEDCLQGPDFFFSIWYTEVNFGKQNKFLCD